MLHWLWVLIVGAIIGAIAGALTKNGGSMGWISNILAGLIGSSLGEALLGAWGPYSQNPSICRICHRGRCQVGESCWRYRCRR